MRGASATRWLLAGLLFGCGTSARPLVDTGGGGSASDAGPDVAVGTPTPPGTGGAADGGAPADAGVPPGDSGGTTGPVACPVLAFGSFGSLSTSGTGCADLDTSAAQCIKGSTADCVAHFVSGTAASAAVNGDAQLLRYGNFVHAAMTFGTASKTNCTGSWDAPTTTMTVTCGACAVSMVRTGDCP